MSDEHLPLTATHELPRVQTDVPLPPRSVPALPRPRDDEAQPFHARTAGATARERERAPEWLVAYA